MRATPRPARAPILAYHSISDRSSASFRRYTLAPSLFRDHVAYLAEAGYETLTVPELVCRLRRGDAGRCVALTFDDAFADFADEALPALREHGATATVFVPTACVGGTSAWLAREGEAGRPLLSWAQLGELARAGVECGAHSRTHPELDRLPRRELEREVRLAKDVLEERLGRAVRMFAYPFGYHSRRVRKAVEAAGYTSACAVGEVTASAASDRYALPRLTVAAGTDVERLALLLGDHGGWRHRASSELKRGVWQARRRWVPA